METPQLYQVRVGDEVQLRPDVRELIANGAISHRGGWVSGHMDRLIGKKLTVKRAGAHLESFKGRTSLACQVEECTEAYIYNYEWLIPWEVSELDKIRNESIKI